MATNRKDLETRLIANDQASKVIDKVADKVEQLEKPAEIPLTADDKATPEIRSVTQLLEGLSKEDQQVVLTAKVGDAERDVKRLLRSLKDVDQMDQETIDIRVQALGTARADLDRIQDELRQLDGTEADVKVSATGLDGILGKLDSLPGKFGEMGSALSSALGPLATGGGATLGVVAIAGGLLAAADHAADIALEAQTMAKLTGDTVENASKLQQIWKTTGADVNDLNDIVVQLNGALQQSPELAGKLGINLDDGKTVLQRFVQVIDLADKGLISMTDQSTLFGEEGIRQVAALTSRTEDLAKLTAGMEPPVTEEDAKNALAMKQAIADMTVEFQQLAVQLGQFVVPAADEVFHKLGAIADLVGLVGDKTFGAQQAEELRKMGEAIPVQDVEAMKEAGVDSVEAWKDLAPFVRTVKLDSSVAADAAQRQAIAATAAADATEIGATHLKFQSMMASELSDQVQSQTRQYLEAAQARADADAEAAQAQADAQQQLVDNFKQMVDGIVAYRDALKSVDWKQTDIQGGIAGMQDFADAHFGLAEIAKDAADAESALGDAVKENGAHFDLSTEKGLRNLDAIEQVASTVDTKLAAAYDNANGNQRKFRESAEEIADTTLARLSEQMGLSETQTADLAEALGLMPEDIRTRYELSGTEEAQLKLDLLSTSIDDLPDNVKTKVTQEIIKGDYQGALKDIQDYYDDNPATVVVVPTVSRGPTSNPIFGGPTTGGLTVGATATAPATTSAAVPVHVAAAAQQVKIETHLHAAVIGSPFDVMRAVDAANRRAARMLPKVM